MLKFADFGTARKLEEGTSAMPLRAGTSGFAALEVLELPQVGFASDVYAFGATVFWLLFGRPPFCKVTNGVFDIAEVMRGQRAGLVAAGFPPGLELDLHLREFFRVCSRSACVSTLLDVNRRSVFA